MLPARFFRPPYRMIEWNAGANTSPFWSPPAWFMFTPVAPRVVRFGRVTDAVIGFFDAALGTHKATTNADKTANAKPGTLKVDVNGTIYHIQLYAT